VYVPEQEANKNVQPFQERQYSLKEVREHERRKIKALP
jgi:hypothetical protein